MPYAPAPPCSDPFCPERRPCPVHRQTTSARGYGAAHRAEAEAARPGAACELCGSTVGLQRDHRVPRSLGGSDEPANRRWLCASCHARFGVRSSSRRPELAGDVYEPVS